MEIFINDALQRGVEGVGVVLEVRLAVCQKLVDYKIK